MFEQNSFENFEFLRTKYHNREMLNEDLGKMAFGVIAWSVFYLIIKHLPLDWMMHSEIQKNLTHTQNIDLRNRLVSLFHGIMAFSFAAYHMATNRSECGDLNTPY